MRSKTFSLLVFVVLAPLGIAQPALGDLAADTTPISSFDKKAPRYNYDSSKNFDRLENDIDVLNGHVSKSPFSSPPPPAKNRQMAPRLTKSGPSASPQMAGAQAMIRRPVTHTAPFGPATLAGRKGQAQPRLQQRQMVPNQNQKKAH
ncbi:MAG: hypothetical protein C5B49_11030 [Bdellovibrio sp.]|nr:MAG: hypothetical protein C5B49_11030 [Bdellovibrio sp.]